MLEEVEGGRRVLLEWPIAHLHATIGVVVLDSEQQQGGEHKMIECAAMLVPSGREADWVFSSEGGQWQLLASSGAARLILLMRQAAVSGEDCSSSRKGLEESQLIDDDEKLKQELSALVVALAPKACFRNGPPVVPYLSYEDNVAWRRVVGKACSALTGLMLVEDVRLANVADGEATLRRRLRFKQMPNLIQTEVPLLALPIKSEAGDQEDSDDAKLMPDHGVLVHVYLAPLVAGLWLVSPTLEACIACGELARVLCVGIGGGALPMFLNRHFDGFHVEAVDLDEVVVNLAMRHFGLVEGKNLRIRVEDGVVAVARLADQFTEQLKAEEVEIPSHAVQGGREKSLNDPRMHAIIVDVNAGDARAGLSSPPQAFLEREFLVAARLALHQGGMLAMNVMPNGESMHKAVIDALIDVFEHVYEIQVAGGENYGVFALPWCRMEVGADNLVASKVKSLISPELVKQIHRAE